MHLCSTKQCCISARIHTVASVLYNTQMHLRPILHSFISVIQHTDAFALSTKQSCISARIHSCICAIQHTDAFAPNTTQFYLYYTTRRFICALYKTKFYLFSNTHTFICALQHTAVSVLLPQYITRSASERMQKCNLLQKVVVWSFFHSFTKSLKMCKTRIHNLTAFTKFSVLSVLPSPPEEHREPVYLSPPEEHRGRAPFLPLSLILSNDFPHISCEILLNTMISMMLFFIKLFWNDFRGTGSVLSPQYMTQTASERFAELQSFAKSSSMKCFSLFYQISEDM